MPATNIQSHIQAWSARELKIRWAHTEIRIPFLLHRHPHPPIAVHYPIPLNRQPAGTDTAAYLPVGDAVARKVMSLSTHLYLAEETARTIVEAIAISLTATS